LRVAAKCRMAESLVPHGGGRGDSKGALIGGEAMITSGSVVCTAQRDPKRVLGRESQRCAVALVPAPHALGLCELV